MFHVPEKSRVTTGPMATNKEDFGNNGLFLFKLNGVQMRVICSDMMGWEHVSVSTATRCPTWEEMCAVKDLFWDEDDCVVQFHPPKSDYVNMHPYTLHLWREVGREFRRPPSIMVGVNS